MNAFNKVERRPLSEVVAGDIEDAIVSGTFAIGSQLPSEQQLATEFGVSRNVVREAFKFLKERGLITILNGSGAYVCQPSGEPTSNALGRYIRLIGANESVKALYEARRILEVQNVRLAAERAAEQDLATLATCLKQMTEHGGAIEKWAQADLDFHLAIANATHNPFLRVLLEPLVDQLHGVIAISYDVPGGVERGLESHTKVFSCIKNRDPDGAQEAILEHLLDSEARVLKIDSA